MFSKMRREPEDDGGRYLRDVWGVFASCSALQTDSSRRGEDFRDADEVVARRR